MKISVMTFLSGIVSFGYSFYAGQYFFQFTMIGVSLIAVALYFWMTIVDGKSK